MVAIHPSMEQGKSTTPTRHLHVSPHALQLLPGPPEEIELPHCSAPCAPGGGPLVGYVWIEMELMPFFNM